VTLLSASPGSGKTVLLRSWIADAGLGDRVAWVSVERGERDAQRFWQAVLGALRAAVGSVGRLEQLAAAPQSDGQDVVDRLIAELETLDEPLVLVIDDLHELASPDALAQLERLLARRPRLLQVVIATRRDPRLGLHRLRLAGGLAEIREADLRFTLAESRELLAGCGIALSNEGVALLHARTEGWAAGLRLAALSLARHPDPERFVAEFSGSERTVAEYLLAEVLQRQPPEVRRRLLRTSILERVNGALADLLTGGSSGERILQELEEANAFVVALDAGRSWFRYHHLLADLLRLELRATEPAAIGDLHDVATAWYAEHGSTVEAIRHAPAEATYHADLLAGPALSAPAAPAPAGAVPELLEQLSKCERRVLRYLPSHLSALEIGAELVVSLNTVKTHLRHIYEKLGVHGRTEAVERARAFGLLTPGPSPARTFTRSR
jgi:LuxR family maltose regulon positive regulatory protein